MYTRTIILFVVSYLFHSLKHSCADQSNGNEGGGTPIEEEEKYYGEAEGREVEGEEKREGGMRRDS
jgi:hypothetical protein